MYVISPPFRIAAAGFVAVAVLTGCAHGRSGAAAGTASALAKSSTAPAAPTAAASTPRAKQAASPLLDSAISAMRAQKSVHISCTVYGLGDETQSMDVGVDSGRVTSVDGTVSIANLLLNGVAYLTVSSARVLAANGLPQTEAEKLAGKWISMQPGDSYGKEYLNYTAAARGMTLASQADALQVTGHLERTGLTRVQGTAVYRVSGDATRYYSVFNNATKGSVETVYIAASGAPLPVSVSAHSSGGIVTTCSFSSWNKPLRLTAPAGAVPLSSIPAS